MSQSSIQPGIVSATFRALTVEEIVRVTAESGLVAIEWSSDVHVPVGDLAAGQKAKDLTDAAGLKVASYGSYYRAGRGESFSDVVHSAANLGAPNIRVWPGDSGSAESDTETRKAVVRDLQTACSVAEQFGITVSLEFHGGTLTDTLGSTLQLIDEVDRPNLKVYWQPVPDRPHPTRLHELDCLLPYLSNLHVFQWTKAGSAVVRHPLVEGGREWPDYLRLAEGDRFALLEFVPQDDPQTLCDEARALRRWLNKIS